MIKPSKQQGTVKRSVHLPQMPWKGINNYSCGCSSRGWLTEQINLSHNPFLIITGDHSGHQALTKCSLGFDSQ